MAGQQSHQYCYPLKKHLLHKSLYDMSQGFPVQNLQAMFLAGKECQTVKGGSESPQQMSLYPDN